MKLFTLPVMTTFLALSACSQAAEPPAKLTEAPVASAAPDMEPIGNWLMTRAESHVKFSASQQGKAFAGEFKTFDALINFKKDAIEDAQVVATIHLGSVEAGDADRDGALPGKEWFDVKNFPKAVFQSDDFIQTGEDTYEARGTLAIKGKTQPLTLPFTLDISGSKAQMQGAVTLDRTLWEVGTGAWSTDEWVSTEVVVDVKISAESPF